MTRIFFMLLITAAWACAGEPAPRNAPYSKMFDPWRACQAAEDLAKRGAPDALRTMFLAAYVLINQPFLGGEDLETMGTIFRDVLPAVGDSRFAEALSAQRPDVRSAVRWFLAPDEKRPLVGFPKTAALLRVAPKVDWPLLKAYREN